MTKSDLTLRVPLKRLPMTHAQHDANFQRLMYFSSNWAAGTYEANEVVLNEQAAWVVRPDVPTTTQEPTKAAYLAGGSDWYPLSISPWGFGQLLLNTPNLAFPDLGAGWAPITNYTTADFAQNTVLDAAAGTIEFEEAGVWEITITFAMLHNSSNSGRITNLRIYDVVGGNPGTGTLPVGIGRNAEATDTTLQLWADITDTDVANNLRWRVELGGGDAVTVDEMTLARFAAKKLA